MKKLLIANRGEIACRIIATARRMGIATVAVHSDADAAARHVQMADEAVQIGPAAAAESYLSTVRILDASARTGADAIHPGYGFLSESPDFAEAVVKAGLTWVGPPASAIRAMGLKDAAKAKMKEAGVPVVPGYHGADQTPEILAREADQIGYPVLIKARAGGGGKGMRRVDDPAYFAEACEGAQREGRASFGDPAVLIEKYIETARHIEIQVFADRHGNLVHLFERDCSLQRRHQKVIEEAPAPGMTAEMRAAMGAAAVEAARSVGYVGAGTVEFIVDGRGALRPDAFWFMEMNTRLQVEHPVTEAITHLDLVELQLRVAEGAPLPFTQTDLAIKGHAIEARLYAEDVPRGFLPAVGRLERLTFPPAAEFACAPVRVDSGVEEGGEISPWYDPMIAKVIVHAETREAALDALARTLAATVVEGTVTNLDFLLALVQQPDFVAGQVDTGLIGRELDALVARPVPKPAEIALAAVAVAGGFQPADAADPWQSLRFWRLWGGAAVPLTFLVEGQTVSVRLAALEGGHYRLQHEGTEFDFEVSWGSDEVLVRIEGHSERFSVRDAGGDIMIRKGTRRLRATRLDPLDRMTGETMATDTVLAPMPGLVKSILTEIGATVSRGTPLMVLEAMKMEHTLTAPRDGVIDHLGAVVGAQVADGGVLIRFAAEDE